MVFGVPPAPSTPELSVVPPEAVGSLLWEGLWRKAGRVEAGGRDH